MKREQRFFGIMAAMGLALMLARCAAPSVEQRQGEAEAKYGAALLACVDDASTLAESRACRANVDRAWGVKPRPNVPADMFVQPSTFIDGGPRDAGSDQ